MSGRDRRPRKHWSRACAVLQDALEGPARQEVLDHAMKERGDEALRRLRDGMRSHTFASTGRTVALAPVVRRLDERTRQDGFHVLLEWDHAAHRFLENEIPVLVLDVLTGIRPSLGSDRQTLGVVLDCYFLYLLALLVLRAWDEGDPNENLDRVEALLGSLAGPWGSGRTLVARVETLLFLAISTYEPDDRAFHRLLDKVRSLDEAHQTRIALIGSPLLGSHLRWGFPVLYHNDLARMRADNVADYPWLLFSLTTLTRAWTRLRDRQLAGALLGGLTPDPWAFLDDPPGSLADYEEERRELEGRLRRHRQDLLEDFRLHRPSGEAYSPLGLHFNFPHNALIAVIILTAIGEQVPNIPLDALLTGRAPSEEPDASPLALARMLTDLARANPERRGNRRVMMLGYDPGMASRAWRTAIGALEDAL